jgi:hypothetical protein
MASVDVEALARDIVITYSAPCRVCGHIVEWQAAQHENREPEAPLDGSGDIVCDEHRR